MFRALFTRLFPTLLLIGMLPVLGEAQIGELEYISEEPAGYEESHKVMPGESLYGIARQYGISVEEVRALNQLADDTIYPGQRLIVTRPEPSANMRTRGYTESATTVRPPMNGYADLERRQYYRVQENESIEDIARKFRIHPDQIRDWNAVSQVYPGQTLVVDKWTEKVNMYDLRGREASANLRTTRGQSAPTPAAEPVGNLSTFDQGPFAEEDSYRSGYRTYEEQPYEQVQDGEWLMERPAYRGTQNEYQRSAYRSANNDYATQRRSNQRTAQPVFDQIEVSGPYEVMEDRFRGQGEAFYAYHNELPVGSKVEIQIPNNSGFIELEVIGRMPRSSRGMIGISPAAARIMEGAGVYDQRLTIRY